MEELKPCPFCGDEAELKYCGSNYYEVDCRGCGGSTGIQNSKEEAVALWNTRTCNHTDEEYDRLQELCDDVMDDSFERSLY
jgi:Lar family restriction alleviation protein